MPKFVVRITRELSLEGDRKREGLTLLHTEKFDKCGAMLLWSQDWYKTTGANRTEYVERKRTVRPKEYAAEDWKVDLNWARTQPYNDPKYREAAIVETWEDTVTDPYRHSLVERRCGLENSIICMEVFRDAPDGIEVLQHWLEVVQDA